MNALVPAGDRFLCIDTDALFCLLSLGLLNEAISCLGFQRVRCYRLTQAVHQARTSAWVEKHHPGLNREKAAHAISELQALPVPDNVDLQEQLNREPGIDTGEVIILASAALIPALSILTGDIRMLIALFNSVQPEIQALRARLRGRIALLPSVIGALVSSPIGLAEVETRWRASRITHRTLAFMFGSTSPTPMSEFRLGLEAALAEATAACGRDYLFLPDLRL